VLTRNLSWLSGAALFSLLFAAKAAHAELESDGRAAGVGELAAVSACAAAGDAAETRICEGGRLRWRLCEQGFRSENLPDAGIDECFLNSF
jgi:hypothetical protein